MKGFILLTVCCLAAVSLAQDPAAASAPSEKAAGEGNTAAAGGASEVDGRTRGRGRGGKDKPNTRFFGGAGLGGLFGGIQPGLGGIAPGLGGIAPGLGGFTPGLGGGIAPGLGGGLIPGLGGGIAPGLGGGLVPGLTGGVSQTCRRWCRTPQRQAYCCESNNEPDTIPFQKGGFCPPVRPVCPPTRSFHPPESCSNDSKCIGVDKCCFDTCLQQHVCKPPIGSSPFGFGG